MVRRDARQYDDPLQELLGQTRGGERAARFISHLTLSTGQWDGQPFRILPFQRETVDGLYQLDAQGRRKVREALLFWPRKSGKTTMCAALALYETFAGLAGAEVVVAANSRDQASQLFKHAASFCESSEILSKRAWVSRATKRMVDKVTRSEFRVISADAFTAHGMDLTCWIYDELHGAPNRELYDVLSTSTGARKEALGIVISTAGYNRETSILGEIYRHAKGWQQDPASDPAFYAHLLEAPPEAQWDDEATWRATNPALDNHRDIREMRLMAERARSLPARQAAFRRLYLNQWTESEHTWIDMAAWDRCADQIDWRGATCWAGLDLSAREDLTACAVVWRAGDRVGLRHWAWIPEAGLADRERRDRVPYSEWARQGLIEVLPGEVIDHLAVIERIKQIERDIRAGGGTLDTVMFDSYMAEPTRQALVRHGLRTRPVGTSVAAQSPPTKELSALVKSGQLAHGGCPLLRWQATCATTTATGDQMKLVKPDRMKHAKRIDSIVATVMAIDGLMRFGERRSVYEDSDVRWL